MKEEGEEKEEAEKANRGEGGRTGEGGRRGGRGEELGWEERKGKTTRGEERRGYEKRRKRGEEEAEHEEGDRSGGEEHSWVRHHCLTLCIQAITLFIVSRKDWPIYDPSIPHIPGVLVSCVLHAMTMSPALHTLHRRYNIDAAAQI